MPTNCSFCDDVITIPNECRYCSQTYCADHQLPENHNCPGVTLAETHGPDFRDFGKDILVNEARHECKNCGRAVKVNRQWCYECRRNASSGTELRSEDIAPKPRPPQSKGDHRDPDQFTDELTCPTCDRETDQIFKCEDCGRAVCPACEGVYEHECPGVVTTDGPSDSEASEFDSLLQDAALYATILLAIAGIGFIAWTLLP